MQIKIHILVVALIILPSVYADIVVFDAYKTTYTYDDGKLLVKKDLRLKNVGTSPIIPGEIHFRVSQSVKGENLPPEINNFAVTNKFQKKLDSKQVRKEDEVDLVFTIWDPLLPQFFYDFTMEYEILFKPRGLMFYQITIPQEKTTISIRKSETEFLLPTRYFVTHAPDAEVETREGKKVVRWVTDSQLSFEYSIVPMPRLGFPAVNLFWAVVILILLGIFILRTVMNRR